MPAIVVAAAGYAASAAVTYGLAGTALGATLGVLGTQIVGGVVGALVSGIGTSLLTPKPKTANLSIAAQESSISTIVRSSVESQKLVYGRTKLSGTLVFVTTTDQGVSEAGLGGGAPTVKKDGRSNAFLHMVIALAGHEIDAVEKIYIDDTEITLDANGFATNAPYKSEFINANGQSQGVWSFVRVKTYLGTDNQTADSDLQGLTSLWTANHRLRGVAYLYVELRWYDRVFPNGIPNISAVIRGKKVYDPRTTLTAWSENYALCVRDFISNSKYGLGASSAEIDDTAFIAAANLCDEAVSLKAGGTQARYTVNGAIDLSTEPLKIIENLTTAAAGVVTYSQGKFQIYPAAYPTPTITIDASWLRGGPTINAKTPRKERFNAVRGVFIDPSKLWQPTDFPAVVSTIYASYDKETIYRDIELPFVTDAERAQRLSTIYLEQQHRAITLTLPCNLKAFQVKVWDTVLVTLSEFGFASKSFRIMSWTLNGDGGIDLELREDDANVYAWSSSNTQTPTAPATTNLPSPFTVSKTGAPTITEQLYVTADGAGVKSRAIVSWAESTGPFVWRYRLEWKKDTDSTYSILGETAASSFTIDDVAAGNYSFRVKTINTILAESDYSDVTTVQLYGLTAAPSDITGLSIAELKGNAHLTWDQSVDLDVRIGGSIRIKHTRDTVSPSWANSFDIGPALSGISTNATLPMLSGYYLVKAVDSTGNESKNAVMILSNLADLLNMNVVQTADQAPTFSGTKTGMTVVGGALQLDGSVMFDSVAGNFDSASGMFDSGGGAGFVTAGSYTFASIGGGNSATIDLAQSIKCRMTADIRGSTFDSSSLFDYRSGLFDDTTGLFDGQDLNPADATLYVRTTDGDPTGSPTWGPWTQFFVGDYKARAYQFRLDTTSQGVNYNLNITKLSVTADVPDRDEKFLSQALAAGGSPITYAQPFFAKPLIFAVIQGTTSGDTLSVTHTTSGGKYTGATVQVLNGGSGVARTVDIGVRGY